MTAEQELKEIHRFLTTLGARWSIRHEEWVKEVIKQTI